MLNLFIIGKSLLILQHPTRVQQICSWKTVFDVPYSLMFEHTDIILYIMQIKLLITQNFCIFIWTFLAWFECHQNHWLFKYCACKYILDYLQIYQRYKHDTLWIIDIFNWTWLCLLYFMENDVFPADFTFLWRFFVCVVLSSFNY